MPLLHCTKCHHEWEGSKVSTCEWCADGTPGRIIAEDTPSERLFGQNIKDAIKITKDYFRRNK